MTTLNDMLEQMTDNRRDAIASLLTVKEVAPGNWIAGFEEEVAFGRTRDEAIRDLLLNSAASVPEEDCACWYGEDMDGSHRQFYCHKHSEKNQ